MRRRRRRTRRRRTAATLGRGPGRSDLDPRPLEALSRRGYHALQGEELLLLLLLLLLFLFLLLLLLLPDDEVDAGEAALAELSWGWW